ncbi:TadE/TadG family type IV pilus assembly protein [Methylobacterium segetis]|uniref:TadE/TadG family type IV pilus assembly protein n=1 Tax=Methylobacterium segetis TaxID=2488750 RepID=UPI00104B6725|nr:TadE/TadG family type IV pilus assembly protein [Methylobacterium segetis]
MDGAWRGGRRGSPVGSLIGDGAGSAAVEFALTAVPFLGFVFVIFQVALYHFALQSLDSATRTAARLVMTGNVQAKSISASQFRTQLLCPALRVPIDCSKITVSISKIAKVSSAQSGSGIYAFIDQTLPALRPVNLDPNKSVYCLGGPGDYLFIDVAYSFLSFGRFVQAYFGESLGEALILRSTTFVYNEPFQVSSGSAQAGC